MPTGKTVAQLDALSNPSSDDLLLTFDNATAKSYKTTITELSDTVKSNISVYLGTTSVPLNRSSGTLSLSGVNLASPSFTGVVSVPLGTAGAPSITLTGDTNTGIYSPDADQIALATGGTQRLTVDASGNVGIGQASIAAVFGRTISATGVSGATFRVAGDSVSGYLYASDGLSSVGLLAESNHSLVLGTNSTERLRIDSSGNVGIGTSSPGAKLDVRSSSSTSLHISDTGFTPDYRGYTIDLSRAQQTGGISFTQNSPTAFLDLYSGGSAANLGGWDGAIRFFTGSTNSYGTERLRIDSSGRLLVGTSSARTVSAYGIPAVQNESTSHETSSLALISNSNTTASPALVIAKTRGTSNGSFTVVSSGDALGVIQFQGADGTQLLAGARISTEVDGTPGANDMPGRLVFSTTADGASSPTERLRITSTGQVRLAGAGITFNGDTATANELDDYEEGTATVSYTTTGGTFTHGGQSLIYTKVGDTVFCRMGLSTATTSPGTGEITITGLPFQVKAAGGANSSFVAGAACGIVHQEVTNSFTTQPFVVVPIQGTSTLKLKASGSTGSFMDATAFANTANNQYNWILTEFWYHV